MKIFQLTSLALALSLAGCSGPVDSIDPEPELGVTTSKTGKTGSNGEGGSDKESEKNSELKISDIKLTDAVSGEITSSVTTDGAKAMVVVTDKAGKPVENAIVTFSGGGVTFNSQNGAVLTNAKGEASIFLSPTNSSDTSAYSMISTANYKGVTVKTNPVNYSLQALNIALDELTIAEETLESGSSTLVSLVTKNESTKKYKNNIKVNFSATCGAFEASEVTSSSQGNVTNTYKSIGKNGLCQGEQTITVTSSGGVSKSIKVIIKKIEANSIKYEDTNPKYLNAKGSGAYEPDKQQIEFTVFANGKPASNQKVELELVKAPTDFSFVSLNNRNQRILKSDAEGKVKVTLYPGDIPGPIEVKASLVKDRKVFTFSRNVSVAKGRPLQQALTIAVDDSVSVSSEVKDINIWAFVRDRQGNPAPQGTVVNFVSEGGVITPQCSTDIKGRCKVVFTTQRPHPVDGRVTILAYTEGEKAYIDMDESNTFTEGDKFVNNIGSFFRDDNENGKVDDGEFVYRRPLKGNKIACGKSSFDEPNIAKYFCDDRLDTTVRTQILMGLSSSKAVFRVLRDKASEGYFIFKVYGNNFNSMTLPSGTQFSIDAVDRTPNSNKACKATMEGGYKKLPKVIDLLNVDKYATYVVELSNCEPNDKIVVNYQVPNQPPASRTFLLK